MLRRLVPSLTGARRDPLARRLLSPGALRLTAPWRFAVAPAATLLAFLVQLGVSPRPSIAPFVFFFAAVAVSSWLGGRGPGLVSVVLSAVLANSFLFAPAWSGSPPGAALTATALFLASASLVALLCSMFRQSVFRIERTAQALHESEERFRQLADALPQMVFDLDRRGETGYFNEQWRLYTGREAGDGRARLALVHPDDRRRMVAGWSAAVKSGSPYECEFRFRRHDGEYRWVLSRALPVHDADGRVTRWFGTATDIHELKQTQEAMRETARLKDEFLAMLSHELRNPLAPISNSLYILEHVEPGSEPARRAHGVIARQAAHLSKLVNELLDATRLSHHRIELHEERLDLNAVVGRAVEDHRTLFDESGVSLELTPAADPVFVNADGTRLAQVVGNLLQNAAKFTRAGGHASVRVGREPEGTVVQVRDDGVGIVPETLDRLFQPFTQGRQSLDRGTGGLGLGLALVKGLVELHGGSVSAHSDGLGKGSEFVVRLPLAAERAPLPQPPRASGVGRPRRILVIEDNADAASSLREMLGLWGHEVSVAHEGAAGIERARALRPDFILCDIGLPGMDGYSVARAVRADETLKGVRLVALSGYALPDDLRRAAEAGFEEHLSKPPALEDLSALLGQPNRALPRE